MEDLKDGTEIIGAVGWCDLCDYTFGGSATPRRAKHLNGKFYHLECYPKAIEVYLADLRLKGQEA